MKCYTCGKSIRQDDLTEVFQTRNSMTGETGQAFMHVDCVPKEVKKQVREFGLIATEQVTK